MSEEKIDAYTVYATTDYVDEQLNSANSSKLISHVLPIEATEENQTIFPINLETFDAANDTILVQDGITLLLPNSGFTIENNTIVMTTPWGLGDTGSILILKNTPILADEVAISGAVIENNSITLDKLSADITTELDEIKKSASDGKALVAGAITDKGIETAADATFEIMATNIGSIVTLDSVPSLEAAEITPGASNQVIAAGNFLKGDQTITGDANLVAANIAKGKSIFGVTGTYDPVTNMSIKRKTYESSAIGTFTFTQSSVTYSITGTGTIAVPGTPLFIQLYAAQEGTYRKWAYIWLVGAFYSRVTIDNVGYDEGETYTSSKSLSMDTLTMSVNGNNLTITMNSFSSLYNSTFKCTVYYI